MEQAGADALELNVYYLPMDPTETPEAVERRTLDTVRKVKEGLRIPVAVKLSPFFSNMGHFALQVEQAGADALVIFNRFLQPDIDLEALEASPRLILSNASELQLRLRWLAILHPHLKANLAVTGGVHSGMDALKAVAAGASAVQVVSAILMHGPKRIGYMRQEMAEWLEEKEYDSLAQLKGSMDMAKCPDPQVFARANYMKILGGWKRTW
jgi:dihydroorotate dehydrogenase (fumarate)